MKCFDEQQALLAALGLAGDGEQDHLAHCTACRAKADSLAPLVERIAAAHEWFDRGHADQREHLLAALAAEPQSALIPTPTTSVAMARLNGRAPFAQAEPSQDSTFRFRHSFGDFWMKHRIALSSAGLAAALLLAGWLLLATRPLSAMEQVAAKIREATSFSFEMSSEFEGKPMPGKGKFYWKAPGTVRLEEPMFPEGNIVVSIFPYQQPGISIDEQHKTYTRLAARQGYKSPLMMAAKLGSFSGEADKDLGKREIDGRQTTGFQVAAQKVDPDVRGTLTIWGDVETKLPALVEYEMDRPKGKMTMHDFQWNTPLDAKLFDTNPPDGFTDKTPKPPSVDEIVDHIRDGLKFYADVMGGHYPRVKMVYGDVTMNELNEKLGLKHPLTEEQIKSDEYVKSLRASAGFGWINGILRDNSDAAYHGKTVGPADKNKVLLRWKLDSGEYEVIYGDLRSETVPAEQLKELEGK